MIKYLHPDTDPEELVFKDYPKRKREVEGLGQECPRCKRRGGWNLKVDCYESDIPAHRHFRASCGACWGSGYLQKGQTCAHEWRHPTAQETKEFQNKGRKLWRCEHLYVCSLCKQQRVVDSSD